MKELIARWKILPQTLKSSIALFFSSILLKGIAFFTTPIFTRIMEPEQYGIITLYNSWALILEVFALLGLTSAGSFNVGLNDNKKEPYKYMANCLGLCNVVTIIFFLIIFVLKYIGLERFILPNNLLILMFIHFLFYPAQIFWLFYQRFEYKYKLSTTIVTISAILGQIASICGVLNYSAENSAFIKLLYSEIVSLLVSIPIYIYILFKGKKYIDFAKWKIILVFILPLVPHYLAQHIMSSADKIMISNYVGNIEAGIYGVVLNIALILDVFWNAINTSLVPYTFKKLEEKKFDGLLKISNIILSILAIMCIAIMLVAPEIIKILAPKEYYVGVYIVPILVVVSFTKALYNLFANVEFYYKKSNKILTATIVATIVNLLLNVIFIPRFGFVAAAYTTLFSYIVLIIMHYIGYKSCNLPKQLYNVKLLFKLTVVLIIATVVCQFIYFNIYIRYIVIILICMIMIVKRKLLFSVIKELRK